MYSNDLGGTLPLQMPKKKNTRYPNQQFTDADMYAIAIFGGFTTMLAPPIQSAKIVWQEFTPGVKL